MHFAISPIIVKLRTAEKFIIETSSGRSCIFILFAPFVLLTENLYVILAAIIITLLSWSYKIEWQFDGQEGKAIKRGEILFLWKWSEEWPLAHISALRIIRSKGPDETIIYELVMCMLDGDEVEIATKGKREYLITLVESLKKYLPNHVQYQYDKDLYKSGPFFTL